MKQRVKFVEVRPQTIVSLTGDKFELRPDVRLVWLQRVCFWVLRKIGAYAWQERVEYTRCTFDTSDFMDRLFKQRGAFLRLDREPKQLLIGAEDFADMMKCPVLLNDHSFWGEYYKNRRILGLKVTIVPWMRGILTLP